MHVHFISIGGAVMHNLAIALHKKGYVVTGSDDEIFDPARSRLKKYGLLPKETGWHINKITDQIDVIILGMHAKDDNPELQKARELKLKIYSFPEFLYNQTSKKTRVVVGGSHGKTTTTSMIMHVLKCNQYNFDYMVGAQLEGFETMVGLKTDTNIAIFEGDEYLSSALDRRPKLHLYKPHIAILTGIAWDHINVFPSFENYVHQFEIFINLIEEGGWLIYNSNDKTLESLVKKCQKNINFIPYQAHNAIIHNQTTHLITNTGEIPIRVFGNHNLQNIEAARLACQQLGIKDQDFYNTIKDYSGASKRLQLIKENTNSKVYLDFAHAPSKLKATVNAIKGQYPDKKIIACMELHTYSSLNKIFLENYKNTMKSADLAFIYYNPEEVKLKRLQKIDPEFIFKSFDIKNLEVYSDSNKLKDALLNLNSKNNVFLFMSSGNFGGINIETLANELLTSR